jgi:hypothetical protein
MFHLQADVVRAVLHPIHFPADAVHADRTAKSYVGSFAFRSQIAMCARAPRALVPFFGTRLS